MGHMSIEKPEATGALEERFELKRAANDMLATVSPADINNANFNTAVRNMRALGWTLTTEYKEDGTLDYDTLKWHKSE